VSQQREWLEKISIRQQQKKALNRALSKLNRATNGLNTTRNPCDCCGFGLWEDEVESRIALSLGKAISQVAKVRGMVIDDLEDLEDLVE